jgi:hypothetical protein
MRTWKCFVDENLKFAHNLTRAKDEAARKAVIDKKIAATDRAARLTIDFGAYRRAAMQGGIDQPEKTIHSLRAAVQNTSLLRRMLAEIRTSLAKHEVAGSRAFAPSPGYGLISPINGSISWRIIYEIGSETIISRRNIADECRAVGRDIGATPTKP